jgi:adenylate cyclase
MAVSPRFKQDLVVIGWRVLIAAVAGFCIGGTLAWTVEELPLSLGILQGVFAGALIGFLATFFGNVFPRLESGRWLGELSFSLSIIVKSTVNLVIIVFSIRLGIALFYPDGGAFDWASPEFIVSLVISGLLIVGFNLVFEINQMLGQRVLRNFVTGAYHRPIEEERIFLFIDLVGSTGIAERLGALRFHGLLDMFFRGLGECVLEHEGEIHKYVGDEVIISWPVGKIRKATAPIACYFSIIDKVTSRVANYQEVFGVVPSFRAALHAGSVVTGEMGGIKREIVFLGDTVNTTARIMQTCSDLKENFLVSQAAMDLTGLPEGLSSEAKGPIKLRGREQLVELYGMRNSLSGVPWKANA